MRGLIKNFLILQVMGQILFSFIPFSEVWSEPKKLKILIADDEDLLRMLSINFIERHGKHDITEVSSGEEAYKALDAAEKSGRAFDIIISDNNMAPLLGVDLLEKIRAEPRFHNLIFIMNSSDSANLDFVEKVMVLGADGTLAKPPADMKAHIQQIMDILNMTQNEAIPSNVIPLHCEPIMRRLGKKAA